ncbi:hypothetical protein WM31_31830 [Burkholderia ubonensis]|nr:hypothetical protein WM31_31830 [Burkholderia ubonensis]
MLPLSNADVRALSLEGHVALATVRSGHGGAVQIGHLAKTVYVTFFLQDLMVQEVDAVLFQEAEAIIDRCIDRASTVGKWLLLEEDLVVLERLLTVYDAQLEAVPAYLFSEAWERFQRAMVSSLQRPFDSVETGKLEFTISELRAQMK